MAPSTFHIFSQLPCELRLQIWESAIRNWTENFHDSSAWNWDNLCAASQKPEAQKKQSYGINYVRLDSMGDYIPLDCSWNKPHPANRSAYLWHAGLWMACKESREVMRKHWFNDRYSKSHPEYVEDTVNDGLWKWFHGDEEREDLSWNTWCPRLQAYEPWLMATSPGDMFCITPDDHRLLARFRLFREGSYKQIYDYAVEFNPAWISELAGLDKYRPTDRLSPTLAFVMKEFCEMATQEMSLLSVIHLIDRSSEWKNIGKAEEPSVYYDCKHEYIEIDPCNPLATNRLVRSTPLLNFLDQVNRLLKYELTWKRKTSRWGRRDCGLPPDGLSVRKLVRVMARRDKAVVLKSIKGNPVAPKMKQPALVSSSNDKPASEKLAVRWRC